MTDPDKVQALRGERKSWEESLETAAVKNPERKKFVLDSGLQVKTAYDPLDTAGLDYPDALNWPGQYPFTRGIQANMYRGRLWTMRQYAGFGSAGETNARFRYLLDQGQTGLSTAFDLPTQVGFDSDHPLARGEVGKVGVAIDSLVDMEILLEGIPLDRVSTSMTINSPAAILLAMYMVVAEKQGIPPEALKGTIQNDILKEYVARGTYIFPPRESMRLVVDIMAYAAKKLPNWNPISISGYHIREAGSTAVQELAFTLSNAISYMQAAIDAGLDVDSFAPRISFFFNAHLNFFEEIAKYRAARRIWSRLMKERFGAKNERSMMLRFHTQTAGSTLTAQQPDVNVIRVAYQALSAVLGGTQSLHTNSRDEALALPTEHSVLLALRTQQVIAHETGVADTVDPLGGSYFIESLTDHIEAETMRYIEQIDNLGGSVAAIEKGFIQQEIQTSAYRYQKEVEAEERIVVGVNKYTGGSDQAADLLRVDPAVSQRQVERLKEVRLNRNQAKLAESLQELRRAAQTPENLMPSIVEAVRAYATVGEICGILREVFGEYQQNINI